MQGLIIRKCLCSDIVSTGFVMSDRFVPRHVARRKCGLDNNVDKHSKNKKLKLTLN